MVTPVIFNLASFRTTYVAFANTTTYPDSTLNNYFSIATCYIANNGGWSFFSQNQITLALNLMVAHLAQLGTQIAAGNTPFIASASSIDKISVTLEPPPANNQFRWWLNTTPYGSQLLALLEAVAVGGFYTTARPSVPLAFR